MEFEAKDEILSLLGASGCGKSMTLRCIAGVEKPDEGKIILNDRVLFDSDKKINLLPQERKVGLLFQNYALFPNMTLEQNISIGINRDRKDKAYIIKDKIKAFSLDGLEKRYPSQLSGGQQQRVALARMLVNEPEIIMLDEPFSALDTYLRWQMEQELIRILKQHKGTTLYVSHNRDEVFRISDRIAVLNNGKIEELNTRKSLFNNPKTLNSTIITGCKNVSKAKKISDHKIYAIDWNLELVCSAKVEDNLKYVAIRAHDIRPCSSLPKENSLELYKVEIIDDLFSKILVISKNDQVNVGSNIYMNISLEEYIKDFRNDKKTLCVEFMKEKLILLYD